MLFGSLYPPSLLVSYLILLSWRVGHVICLYCPYASRNKLMNKLYIVDAIYPASRVNNKEDEYNGNEGDRTSIIRNVWLDSTFIIMKGPDQSLVY